MVKGIKVAFFVVSSVLIAYVGSRFLLSKGLFDTNNTYHVIFNSAEGLYKSNLVVINGVQIGKVSAKELIMEGENEDKILITLEVRNDIKIPTGSKAILGGEGNGLMGDMLIKIHKNKASNTYIEDGGEILAGTEVGLIDGLTGQINPVTDNLNVTLQNINRLFDFEQKNVQSLNHTIENLNKVLATYDQTGKSLNAKIDALGSTLNNLEQFSNALNNKSTSIQNSLENVETLTSNLKEIEFKQTLTNLETVTNNLNTILTKVNQPDNTVGALLNDKKLYTNLDKSLVNLNLLLKDLRLHPMRYVHLSVFGKKVKEKPIMSDDE